MLSSTLSFGNSVEEVIMKNCINANFDLDLTSYGKALSNWECDVQLGIVYGEDGLNWGNEITSTITIESTSGTIKYATGGSFVDCEVYYATGNGWVRVRPYYGTSGSFVEIS